MSESVLLVEKNEGIVTLTLNRPEARSTLVFGRDVLVVSQFEFEG